MAAEQGCLGERSNLTCGLSPYDNHFAGKWGAKRKRTSIEIDAGRGPTGTHTAKTNHRLKRNALVKSGEWRVGSPPDNLWAQARG